MKSIALPLVLALAACTTTTVVERSGGSGSDSGVSLDAGAPPLTCLGIMSCIQTESCNDNACIDACMAKGSADAQSQLTDLATCYQNASCQDAACLQANCKPQLDACVAGSAPPSTGKPMDDATAPPPGSVPAELVGSWTSVSALASGTEQGFDFNSDGTARYSEGYTGTFGGCSGVQIVQRDGTAVIDATTITLYATKVTETTQTCGNQVQRTGAPKTLSFSYTYDPSGPTLKAVDLDCAAQYPGADTSIAVYCTATYKKQ